MNDGNGSFGVISGHHSGDGFSPLTASIAQRPQVSKHFVRVIGEQLIERAVVEEIKGRRQTRS